MKRHRRLLAQRVLSDTAARWVQCATTDRLLGNAGYVAIGLDHYARTGEPYAFTRPAGRRPAPFEDSPPMMREH
jgi:oxygen-independent coproporphyrinogen III oxidase